MSELIDDLSKLAECLKGRNIKAEAWVLRERGSVRRH